MRRTVPARSLFVAVALAGCNPSAGGFRLNEDPPAHREPETTSVYGDWVLATPADSTAFAGATLVELRLDRSAFAITANYPSALPTVVRGTVGPGSGGLLTLTPTTSTKGGPGRPGLVLVAGQPVTVLASAAGNTMVFSPPGGVTAADPSSVWHRKDAARAAGAIPATTTARP
ncbi:MAG: hypothetical protein ACJ79S_16410 [Gemmatimonadaceae bacterium]